MADPGFPVGGGGGVHPLGGRGPPMWALFSEHAKTKELGPIGGGMRLAHPPRSANAYHLPIIGFICQFLTLNLDFSKTMILSKYNIPDFPVL